MGFVRKRSGADAIKENAARQEKAIQESAAAQTKQLQEQARMAAESLSTMQEREVAQDEISRMTFTDAGSTDIQLTPDSSAQAKRKRKAQFNFSGSGGSIL